MSIEVRQITKRFGSFLALDDVSLHVPTGELVALLGPSGSGKTTLLRVIAGLDAPDAGSVLYEDDDVTSSAARDRNVGFVFQHFALFSHMSVFENVAFALRVRKRPDAEVRARVDELLALIQLQGLEGRKPAQLSGGQRQRVALARALAAQPRVLLLDEPFSALDAKVRQELRRWLRRLHEEIHTTCVFVTHDQEEAFELCDRIVVVHKGRIEQIGSPEDVFLYPKSPFVMDFLGSVTRFDGTIRDGRIQLPGFSVDCPQHAGHEGAAASAWIRTHNVDLQAPDATTAGFAARIDRVSQSGPRVKIAIMALEADREVQVEMDRERWAALGAVPGSAVRAIPRRVRVYLDAAG